MPHLSFVFVLNDNAILSSFAHPHVVPNLYDFFSSSEQEN